MVCINETKTLLVGQRFPIISVSSFQHIKQTYLQGVLHITFLAAFASATCRQRNSMHWICRSVGCRVESFKPVSPALDLSCSSILEDWPPVMAPVTVHDDVTHPRVPRPLPPSRYPDEHAPLFSILFRFAAINERQRWISTPSSGR